MRSQAQRHIEVFKKIRQFLSEDFYLLLPQARTLDSWSGWQFHTPKTSEGFIQAFRNRSREQKKKLMLQEVDINRHYEFTNPYTGDTFKVSGTKLLSEGLEFDLPIMSSRLLVYQSKP